MADKKPIVGIDLGIDPEYLEGIVEQTVSCGIAEALMGKDEMAQQIIHYVLDMKVDSAGVAGNYRSDTPLIQYLVNKAVREAATEALNEASVEMKEQIKKEVKKTLRSEAVMNQMCDAMLSSMLDSFADKYSTKVDFTFEKKERDW